MHERMSTTLEPIARKKGYVTNTNLTLFAIATALGSRVFTALRFPSVINFLHFVALPLACGSVLITSRSRDPKQLAIAKALLIGLLLLLVTIIASALLNDAGVINAIIDFLLLAEPFILVLTIVSMPMSSRVLERFQSVIFQFAMTNLLFAYVQKYVFHMENLPGLEDNIKGLFIGQGAGHVIGGSVTMTFAIYYFIAAKTKPLWFRCTIFLAAFNHLIISDTKQVLLSFIVAYIALYLVNLKDIRKTLLYLTSGIIVISLFYWAIFEFDYFEAYRTWIRPELYGSDGEATKLKFATFRIVPEYYHSPLNWLLGLGPGHTVGRLGGWMLESYWNLFGPLGATVHPASKAIWSATGASWLGDKSSLFSPLFGWAGIWGDLGILGLGAYFYLASLIWRYICIGALSKYLLMTVFVFGLIFSQLEEPGYTLFVASMIGLSWQEQQKEAIND